MTAISSAIGSERRSRVSGFKIKKGNFDNATQNLPQLIAVFGEANSANQAGLSVTKREITSAQEAAELYGWGSPIHQQMRILRPISGEGVGGIPTIVFPQISSETAKATEIIYAITGTATQNATHYVVINGRRSLDFQNYSFDVVIGDTPSIIKQKIIDAISGVLSSPATAFLDAENDDLTISTKWKGNSSNGLSVSFDNQGKDAGITYVQTTVTTGTGTVDLDDSLDQFGNDWYTIVLNPYGADETILSSLEQFNGFPDSENPTGRFVGRVFKPFVSLFGSTLSDKDDLTAITNDSARINQVTNVLCPAPNSAGFDCEASANACLLFARTAQDTPELDVNAKSYPDMPIPETLQIGDMANYDNRDFLIKKGCSTVILENGKYQIQDFVTTYHPAGETPLQYAYPRNLMIDWNVKDGYMILESKNVRDHVLVLDSQVTDVAKSVKPKQWAAVLYDYFDDLAVRALLKDPDFSKQSLKVEVDENNPDRFNTFFRYRRTGVARIQSTDAEAGF
jgi:phage tail sheath gpL-like